jgi:enoyl-[acyl-carrier protein] reductase I
MLDTLTETVRETWGSFDGFLHSLAHAQREDLQGSYYDTSREGFLHAMNVSVYSLTAMVQRLHPLLHEGSSIITLSYLGANRVVENYNVMGVAKAALESSVRYLAKDLGQRRIRVNAVSPGAVKTLSARGISDFNVLLERFNSRIFLEEDVTPESIAGTIVYLFSDLSRPVTGETIHVDAGFHIVA